MFEMNASREIRGPDGLLDRARFEPVVSPSSAVGRRLWPLVAGIVGILATVMLQGEPRSGVVGSREARPERVEHEKYARFSHGEARGFVLTHSRAPIKRAGKEPSPAFWVYVGSFSVRSGPRNQTNT